MKKNGVLNAAGVGGAVIPLPTVSPGQAMLGDKENLIFTGQKVIDWLIYSLPLFTHQPLSFFGKNVPLPIFRRISRTPTPIPFAMWGRWLIKTNCFTYFLLQVKPVIIKIFTFKFENVAFTKLPEKLMIRHNKIYKMIEFFTYFHYFVLSWGTIFWHNITEKYFII